MAKDEMYAFVDETIGALDYIVRDSTIDVCNQMTQTQPSIKISGTYVEGKIAVDTSELINSLQISVSGKSVLSPLPVPPATDPRTLDIRSLLSGVKGGKTTTAVFTAPHAEAHEYGTGRIPGRYFVRNAVLNWPSIVSRNVRKHK